MHMFSKQNHNSRTTQNYMTKFCVDVGEVLIITQEFYQFFGATVKLVTENIWIIETSNYMEFQ